MDDDFTWAAHRGCTLIEEAVAVSDRALASKLLAAEIHAEFWRQVAESRGVTPAEVGQVRRTAARVAARVIEGAVDRVH